MGKYGKVSYMEHKQTGWFYDGPVYTWIAFDDYGNIIAEARTKENCKKRAREKGYSVPAGV